MPTLELMASDVASCECLAGSLVAATPYLFFMLFSASFFIPSQKHVMS